MTIREGQKPRPENYDKTYWDFVAAGQQKVESSGEAISLADLMTKGGFTGEETTKMYEDTQQVDQTAQNLNDLARQLTSIVQQYKTA